jgi:hypothetical protein
MIELIGAILGFLLSCMALSYIFGDNPLFRFAVHLFIGVAAGFAGAVVLRNVVFPNLVLPILSVAGGDFTQPALLSLVPVFLSMLLLTKLFPGVGRAGNLAMAFLVGVGAAIAIGGAMTGTLLPQTGAAMNQLDTNAFLQDPAPNTAFQDFLSGTISIIVTVLTLIYFHFSTFPSGPNAQRPAWIETLAFGGQLFIALTFGVVFAGVYTAALTAMIDRLNALIEYIFAILRFFN